MQGSVQTEEKQQYITVPSTHTEYARPYFHVAFGMNHSTLESFRTMLIGEFVLARGQIKAAIQKQ